MYYKYTLMDLVEHSFFKVKREVLTFYSYMVWVKLLVEGLCTPNLTYLVSFPKCFGLIFSIKHFSRGYFGCIIPIFKVLLLNNQRHPVHLRWDGWYLMVIYEKEHPIKLIFRHKLYENHVQKQRYALLCVIL